MKSILLLLAIVFSMAGINKIMAQACPPEKMPFYSADSSVLIIVDGQVINSEMFKKIDPETIASIDILSENSQSLYGCRGASKLIIITTKNRYLAVVDKVSGEAVAGATVLVEDSAGKQLAFALTDRRGRFERAIFKGQANAILRLSSIGYMEFNASLLGFDQARDTIFLTRSTVVQDTVHVIASVRRRVCRFWCRAICITEHHADDNEVTNFESYRLFPNPARPGERINLKIENVQVSQLTVRVYDISGRLVWTKAAIVKSANNIIELNPGIRVAGTYLVEFVSEKGERLAAERVVIR